MENITLENKTNEVQSIKLWEVPITEILKPGDTIKLTSKTSEQKAYYETIQKEVLDVDNEIEPEPEEWAYVKSYATDQDNSDFIFTIKCKQEVLDLGEGDLYYEWSVGTNLPTDKVVSFEDPFFSETIYGLTGQHYPLNPVLDTDITTEKIDEYVYQVENSFKVEDSQAYFKNNTVLDINDEPVGYVVVIADHNTMVEGSGNVYINVGVNDGDHELDFTFEDVDYQVTLAESANINTIINPVSTQILDDLGTQIVNSIVVKVID